MKENNLAKYCTNCGHGIPDGAKFCSKCGQKVHSTVGLDIQKPESSDTKTGVSSSEAVKTKREKLVGVKGWLLVFVILVLFGNLLFILVPILASIGILSSNEYSSSIQSQIGFYLLAWICLYIFNIVTIVLTFLHKKVAKTCITLVMVLMFLIGGMFSQLLEGNLVVNAIPLLWLVYIYKSKRVKATLTK